MPQGVSRGPRAAAGDPARPNPRSGRKTVETLIPARLERLPWGRFHVLVVVALGITWILDGLEVTLAGSVAGALKASPALRLTDAEVGYAGSAYLIGAVLGALFFGWLTDRLGRKKLFFTTIAVYLTATALTGRGMERALLLRVPLHHRRRHRRRILRDQLDHPGAGPRPLSRPARSRDQRQLLGRRGARRAGRGRAPQPCAVNPEFGWRLAFLTGAVIGLVVFGMRMWIPESPRWLAIHGREAEGEAVVGGIERRSSDAGAALSPVPRQAAIRLARGRTRRWREASTRCSSPSACARSSGSSLMAAQAFFYNAIFFTYALVLTRFYGVASGDVGWYILPFAVGNFLGPVAARPPVRHPWAPADDLADLRAFRRAPDPVGALFERGLLDGGDPDAGLDGRVLRRLAGRQRSHGKPRYDGVAAFLKSREIQLPLGHPKTAPGAKRPRTRQSEGPVFPGTP